MEGRISKKRSNKEYSTFSKFSFSSNPYYTLIFLFSQIAIHMGAITTKRP
jgi:hypothetical protein